MEAYDLIDSKISWQGFIPDHWRKDKLFRLCEKMGSGGTPTSTNENYYNGSIPWIQSGDLTDSYVSTTKKSITEEALNNSSAKMFPRGTLLVALYGATIGKLGIMEMGAATNQACCALQVSKKFFSKFTYYLMLDMRHFLINEAYGGSQPNISQETLKKQYMFIPNIDEQKAIADYLDKACQNIDKTLTLKQQQLDKLEAYRKSVIHEAVTKGLDKTVPMKDSGVDWLGDIPIHWGIDRLKDVSHLREEKTANKSLNKDYLELEDLSQWTGKILNKRNTLEVASQVNVFYKGDVLFGKLRPYLAKYTYADFNGKCTGEILAIKPTRIYGGFLAYYVGSKHFINHCDNFSYGAKMPRINWNTQMGIFPIPIPLLFEEQRIIVDYLDKACTNIDKTKETITNQIKTLTQYRQSLIHECVTGKKRIYQG